MRRLRQLRKFKVITQFAKVTTDFDLRNLAIILALASPLVDCSAQEAPDHGAASATPVIAASQRDCDRAGAQWFRENYPNPDEHSKAGAGKATYAVHFRAFEKRCYLESTAIAHFERNGS